MKRAITIILMATIMIIMFLGIKTFASDDTSLKITTEISAPEAGIYGEGQEITIKFTFNKPIKGTMPKYSIYFGNDSSKEIEVETAEITSFSTEILYKYTIKSGDNGELRPGGFINAAEYQIEDESGNKYFMTSGFATRFERKILANTTISWADCTNAKTKMISEDEGNNNSYKIKLENVTLNTNNNYYVHLSHQKDENIELKHIDDVYDNINDNGDRIWQTTLNSISSEINCNSQIRNICAEAGEIYITICERDNDTDIPQIILESQKLERLSNLPLTQRITAFFFDDSTSTYCWEPYGENERKVNYKIGKVTDINLLNALKNGDSTALKNLLKYAKENTSIIASGTLKLGDDVTITDKLNIVDSEYYFVYFEMETEDGKYMTIEDVNLYQAYNNEYGKWLYNMSDKNFKWNLDEQNTTADESYKKEDSTIANFKELPNTGITITIVTLITIVSIISIIYFRKYKSYKDIK